MYITDIFIDFVENGVRVKVEREGEMDQIHVFETREGLIAHLESIIPDPLDSRPDEDFEEPF